MFGRTDLGTFNFHDWQFWAVLALALTAATLDLARGRIPNALTIPFLVLGLVVQFVLNGWSGAGFALAGVAVGFALLIWMFALGFMGGGDVKLLMAFGAWLGLGATAEVALLSILIGGVFALGVLVWKRRLADFYNKIYRFFVSVAVKELELELPPIDRKLTLPFGLPIAIAAVWTQVGHPLIKWGWLPW